MSGPGVSRMLSPLTQSFPCLSTRVVALRCRHIRAVGQKARCPIRTLHTETPTANPPVPFRKRLKDEAKQRKVEAQGRTRNRDDGAVDRLANWELTVGIEIHAELNTSRKLFSAAATSIGDEPNTHVALFDAAFPGSQPIFQKETLLPALRAAIALNCEVQRRSSFDRKHYFYQDQPAGYQITQYYEPFARDGSITLYPHDGIAAEDAPSVTVPIKQVQMEQDTAKTLYQPPTTYLLDFNRVSHPLVEIISMPSIHHPATAAAYVRKVQSILKSVNACTAGMDMGGLRADVNVSVRRRGQQPETVHSYAGFTNLGQRTEIKNLSSLKAVEDAVVAERDRQIALLESGGVVEPETRGFALGSAGTRRLRGKEGEVDYRYMPDPDIAPVIVGEDLVGHLRATLPALPDAAAAELVAQGVSLKDARTLVSLDEGERLDYFQDVLALLREKQDAAPEAQRPGASLAKTVANWTVHELGGLLTTSSATDTDTDDTTPPLTFTSSLVPAPQLAAVLHLLLTRQITTDVARSLFARAFRASTSSPAVPFPPVEEIVESENLRLQPLDDALYERLAREAVEANPGVAAAALGAAAAEMGGKKGAGKVMWFVGQVMRNSTEGREGRLEAKRVEGAVRGVLGI